MKKVLLIFAAFAAISTASFAQSNKSFTNAFTGSNSEFYAGGSACIKLNFSSNTTFGFGLAPEFGWQFEENMAVGCALSYAFATQSFQDTDMGETFTGNTASNTLYFSPYFRWFFAEVGSLHFALDAVVDLAFQASSQTGKYQGQTVTQNFPTQFAYGIGVRPVVTYDFLNDWQVFATIGRLGWAGVGSEGAFDISALASLGLGVYYRF